MNSNLLTNQNRKMQLRRVVSVALLLMMMMTAFSILEIGIVEAIPNNGGKGTQTDLSGIMGVVIGIVTDAAKYIGLIIAIWGVFQLVLAFRREDSEGISKQITTIVVGAVLVGFGAIVPKIAGSLQ